MFSFIHTILPTSDLSFDVNNPRISDLLARYPSDQITPERISFALRPTHPTFEALQEAIRSFGGIINPIKVNDKDGEKIVFEGNTRLAIYRSFESDPTVPGDWTKIPCVVYEQLSNVEMHNLRLQDHLIGPRDWSPYNKARYLHFLNEVEKLPFEDLVAYCGGDRVGVERRIKAYQMMQGIYCDALNAHEKKNSEDDFEPRNYSIFEVFQRKAVQQAIYDAGFDDDDFANWVVEEKFKRLEHGRELPKIMENDLAKDLFLKEGSEQAIRYLGVDVRQLLESATLPNLCRALIEIVGTLSRSDLQLIRGSQDDVDVVYDCLYALEEFAQAEIQPTAN